MTLTKKQEGALHLLRLDGLRRKIEFDETAAAYKKAQEIEKAVKQYVVDNNAYVVTGITEDMRTDMKNGDRITEEFFTVWMDDDVFLRDFLPKVREAFRTLYGIDNPENFVYSEPFRVKARAAEQAYLMIAVDFLKISGRPEADGLEKAVKGYLKPELKQRLTELNDNFIGGTKTETSGK